MLVQTVVDPVRYMASFCESTVATKIRLDRTDVCQDLITGTNFISYVTRSRSCMSPNQ